MLKIVNRLEDIKNDNNYYVICKNNEFHGLIDTTYNNNNTIDKLINEIVNYDDSIWGVFINGMVQIQTLKYKHIIYKNNKYYRNLFASFITNKIDEKTIIESNIHGKTIKDVLDPTKKYCTINISKVCTDDDIICIFVKFLTGKNLKVETSIYNKISDLKQMICDISGICLPQQRLIFKGQCMVDSNRIINYNIENSNVVWCVLQLRGGMHHVSSGRVDYCSTKAPSELFRKRLTKPIDAAEKTIEYEKNGECKYLHLFHHPNCPDNIIKMIVEIETNDNYFNECSDTDFKNIDNSIIEMLSKDSLLRYLEKIRI